MSPTPKQSRSTASKGEALSQRLASILPIDDAPRAFVGELPSGAAALLALALARREGTALAILPTPHHLDAFLADCSTFLATEADSATRDPIPRVLPFRLRESTDDTKESPATLGARLDVANALADAAECVLPSPLLIASSIQALLQTAPDVRALRAATLTLALSDPFDPSETAPHLEAHGYQHVPDVIERCQYTIRGGILDIWPVNAPQPLRLESDGEALESIRPFDPGTQRSSGTLPSCTIPPAGLSPKGSVPSEVCPQEGLSPPPKAPRPKSLLSLLPDSAILLWLDGPTIEAHAESYLEGRTVPAALHLDAQLRALKRRPTLRQWISGPNIPGDTPLSPGRKRLNLPIRPIEGAIASDIRDPDTLARLRHSLLATSFQRAHTDALTLHLWVDTEGSREHLRAELNEFLPSAPAAAVDCRVAPLTCGFELPPLHLALLAQSDLYGRSKRLATRRSTGSVPSAEALGERLVSIDHISPGDLVVHVEHGIGRFLGTTEITVADRRSEVLAIEYDGGAKLYVPVNHAHLLARYVGAASNAPVRLHNLNGKRWNAEKTDAEAAVRDLAASMLETQARRSHLERPPFSLDVPWMAEFEATFPHAETIDQAKCIADVKRDMSSPHPMDRLVCGDAGYGKTEIAMRAAFLAAIQGRQVVVLVPTTVLAQQHFDSFRERMGPYPIRLGLHCRFCTPADRAATLKAAATGAVDILVGTHGLLSPNVRFHNLGLVIVDEEQRFGVVHKERLKALRALVDVLTLSATPIPRTLQLGLTGLRDLSLLQTPPRERVLTETKIVKTSDDTIRAAIQRELDRGGQVFYLHNRVLSIHIIYNRLRELLPHVRVGVGHGQMPPAEIEAVMRRFAEGEFDVLLSTTIIENGIDIPRANTILIDRADRFGIADLYQLRGRIGRGSRKGYAYLLVPDAQGLDSDARERLKAVRDNSGAGSGFQLALRDLGLRGAGNLLGAAQSGHITAIGFTLYCQLLRQSVARLKGEAPPPIVDAEVELDTLNTSPGASDSATSASLPYSYIEDDPHRIATYRRIAEATSPAEVDALLHDLADRFGSPPPSVLRLLRITKLRIALSSLRIPRIQVHEGLLKICFRDGSLFRLHGALPEVPAQNPDRQLDLIDFYLQKIRRRLQSPKRTRTP